MQLQLYTIDAFESGPFTGNPAAVCPLENWLDDALLQAIAAQNNLSETVYLVPKGAGSYGIRWFTPATEVKLCGHATLAAAFALKTELGEEADTIRFDSLSGPLSVVCQNGRYTLDFPSQPPTACPRPSWLPNALGANPREFYRAEYCLAIVPSEEILAAIEPDFALLAKSSDSYLIVSAPGEERDFVSRFFAPAAGIDEDPVTGSAHCTLTPYWAKRLGKRSLSARQISPRGGELTCELAGDRVRISGSARLYAKATIFV